MKFKTTRFGIEVIPEDDMDVAYIEDTLGLKKDRDSIPLVRMNAMACLRWRSSRHIRFLRTSSRRREGSDVSRQRDVNRQGNEG